MRGLCLAEAARRAGVSRSTLNRWESDEVPPRASALVRLLDVLSVAPSERTRVLAEVVPKAASLELARTPIGSPVHVGQALRSLRTCAFVTQSELARRAGISQAAVAKCETGAIRPTSETLSRILAALGATPESAGWIRRLAAEEPVAMQCPLEAQKWLDAHRPDQRNPGVVPLFAFEREVWTRAARDPRWEPLLAETISWRCLAHIYTAETEASKEAARNALAMARSSGAWDRVQSAIVRLYGFSGDRRANFVDLERTFEDYLSRVKRPYTRNAVQIDLGMLLVEKAPHRAEALAQRIVEEAPPIVTPRSNDAYVRDDGKRILIQSRYHQEDFEGVVTLYESMDCVRAGCPLNFALAHAKYVASAHRLGMNGASEAVDALRTKRDASPFFRSLWTWLDREIALTGLSSPDYSL